MLDKVCLIAILLLATPAAARETPREPSPFSIDLAIDLSLFGTGLLLWTTPTIFAEQLAKPSCDPCSPDSLNALDRSVIHYDSPTADLLSDVTVVAVPALAMSGALLAQADYGWPGVLEDAVIIAQSMVISGTLNQIVRHAVRRPRPFMYQTGAHGEERHLAEAEMSFYSGHSSTAFSAATAFAYLYTLRRPDSRWKWAVWLGSLLAASTVPLCRVLSGEHFWTDVWTGAAVGTGMGLLIPAFHRRKSESLKPVLQAGPSWVGIGAQF